MPLNIHCPHCRATYQVPDSLQGKQGRCVRCRQDFAVLGLSPEPVPAAEAPPRVEPAAGIQSRPTLLPPLSPAAAAAPLAPSLPGPASRPRQPFSLGVVVAVCALLAALATLGGGVVLLLVLLFQQPAGGSRAAVVVRPPADTAPTRRPVEPPAPAPRLPVVIAPEERPAVAPQGTGRSVRPPEPQPAGAAKVAGLRTAVHLDSPLLALAMPPDSPTLATLTEDNAVTLWDMATGQQRARFVGIMAAARVLKFSPDGRRLATGAQGDCVQVRATDTGQVVQSFATGEAGYERYTTFTPDSKGLILATRDRVEFRDVETGKLRQFVSLRNPSATRIFAVDLSADGQLLFLGTQGLVPGGGRDDTLWSVPGGQRLEQWRPFPEYEFTRVQLTPDGRRTIYWQERTPVVRVWDRTTGKEMPPLQGPAPESRPTTPTR